MPIQSGPFTGGDAGNPGKRSVLLGRYAEASVGGVLIALLFDWKIHYKTDKIDSTGHSDLWRRHLPTVSEWEFTSKGYIIPGSANHYGRLWSAGSTLSILTVTGYSGSVAAGTPIFQGQGFPSEFDLSAPMVMATQEFKICGYGAPSVGVAA